MMFQYRDGLSVINSRSSSAYKLLHRKKGHQIRKISHYIYREFPCKR